MSRTFHSWRIFGGLIGIFLGLGAPSGCLLFRMAFAGQPSPAWFQQELAAHAFFYLYMSLATPFVFFLFGFFLGFLEDKAVERKAQLEHLNVKLEEQLVTDDLTGLYNHRFILPEIAKEAARARRYGRVMSIMMMDLDDFKKVNDRYGHPVGNFLLKEVAQILKNSVRLMDILGRYGGDEFLVILPETPLNGAKAVGERIAKNIREHRFVSGEITITMTVSMGLYAFEDSGEVDSQGLIAKADQALLEAKRKGKDFLFVAKGR